MKVLFLEFSSGDVAADLSGEKPLLEEATIDSDVALSLSVKASSGDINLRLAE